MTYPVLSRADEALTPAEQETLLRDRIGDGVLDTLDANGTFTVTVSPDAWVATAAACKNEPLLAYDMFDCLFGVDRGDDGFDVVAVLYSTSRGQRILLQMRCEGGRDEPVCPTLVEQYAGANWMERETWDMFGIEFDGHPGLTPRILCAENFEGWPLRKDFYLASREAKPWPGVKEPAELDEDGNPIVKIPGPGEAVGPSVLDEVMAEQAKIANPRTEPDAVEPAAAADASEDGGDQAAAADTDEPAAAVPDEAAADEPSDPPAVDAVSADERAAKDADDAAAAAARAELSRMQQAEAREQKAAEQAEAGSDVPTEGPAVPEGQTPDLRDEGGLDTGDDDADDNTDDGAEEDR